MFSFVCSFQRFDLVRQYMTDGVDVKNRNTKSILNLANNPLSISRCTNSECWISDSIEISLQWHCRWLAWNGKKSHTNCLCNRKTNFRATIAVGLKSIYFIASARVLARRQVWLSVDSACYFALSLSLSFSPFFPLSLTSTVLCWSSYYPTILTRTYGSNERKEKLFDKTLNKRMNFGI